MLRQSCHFHADEDPVGTRLGADEMYTFTCSRTTGHPPGPGSYTWFHVPVSPTAPGVSELAAELGLPVELPAALARFRGRWVEFGVLERAYARQHPDDFATLVDRYGHTAIESVRYSASAFLAHTLGVLSRHGDVLFHPGPATGRWDYLREVSWWTLAPAPDWEDSAQLLSWADSGHDMSYVPGNQEKP